MADQPREKALDGAHHQEREVRDVVPDTAREMTQFVSYELAEIHVGNDELDPCDGAVEARAKRRVEADTPPRLVSRQHEKADEKCERYENEYEISHDD